MNHEAPARALWTLGPGRLALRETALGARAAGRVRCRALYSAVSRGTESLVFAGRVPQSEWRRMRAPFQDGDFPFPVKYGYQMVAEVEAADDAALVGREVFALHPHQDRFDIPESAARPLPPGLPARRAVLAANMETALNALWDSGAGPGDRIAVVGAGVVGLLVAALAAGLPGAEVAVIDLDPGRAAVARALGVRFAPADAPSPLDCDVVFHASASAAGLSTALSLAGFEGTVIELSWYGETEVAAPLGGAFHARRLRLVSSQVGQVSPARRPRWDYGRRLAKALDLLADPRFDALLEPDIPFAEAPERLPAVLSARGPLAQVIAY
jgi:NADPH:quinone reductase-like Zn-dependent oxidoreductase